jgi:hypothetical protein
MSTDPTPIPPGKPNPAPDPIPPPKPTPAANQHLYRDDYPDPTDKQIADFQKSGRMPL